MTTETMTVHEALSELKVIGARIDKEINGATFLTTNKHSNTKINGQLISDYENDIKSAYQKINDLIKRRTAIKRAVVKSNANTEIAIGDEVMTVAEAIEYKNVGIDYLERILYKMSIQYNDKQSLMTTTNSKLETQAEDYVVRLFGNKEKDGTDSSTIEKTKREYVEVNTYDLIDPLNVKKEIEKLNDKIDAFKSKVDSALSVSNATTIIEISY